MASVCGSDDIKNSGAYLSCYLCDFKTTRGKYRMNVHMITHTDLKPFKCYFCEFECNNNTNMNRHMMKHAQDTLRCAVCQMKFKELKTLKLHIRRHGIETDDFMQASINLKKALILDKNASESNYICNDCGRHFKIKALLISHITTHMETAVYTTSKKPKTPKSIKACSVCDYKTSKSSRLAVHMRMHMGIKPYKCDVCDYACTTTKALTVHTLIHTGEKPFPCTLCDARFSQDNGLKHHMNIHTGAKPHKCKLCEAAFRQPSGLRRHLIIHTGEKPYKCATCSKAFSDSSALKRHEKNHAGVKPHVCTECGSKFTSNQNLKKHVRIHRTM